MKKVWIGKKKFAVGENEPLVIVAGPCVIESEEHTLRIAEKLQSIFYHRSSHVIFKASYDKANRSSLSSYRGPGIEKGLSILEKVRKETGLAVFTDVHTSEEAIIAGKVCDVIQIPAFLCRQTDLLLAAGQTGCVINVKKAQFMAPWDMKNVIEKIESTGNENILLTDRGTCFGYNQLVTDFRSIPVMQNLGYPVFVDVTHAVQLPGALGHATGGQREFILPLAKASAALANGLYIEVHPAPHLAKSDAASVYPLDQLEMLLDRVEKIYESAKDIPAFV